MARIRNRHFVCTSGPLALKMKELRASRAAAEATLRSASAKLGGKIMVGYSGSFAGVVFEGRPSSAEWKRLGRAGRYTPNLNSERGRGHQVVVDALPVFPPLDSALHSIGLLPGAPVLMGSDSGHRSTIGHVGDAVFVVVPWRDLAESELAAYEAQKASGEFQDLEYEHLSWTPPPELVEVKEWEFHKAIADAEASLSNQMAA